MFQALESPQTESMLFIHRESKKQDTKLLAITSPIIIRFSKFYHYQTLQ